MPYYDVICKKCGDAYVEYLLAEELGDWLDTSIHKCGGKHKVVFGGFRTSQNDEEMKSSLTKEQIIEEDYRKAERDIRDIISSRKESIK